MSRELRLRIISGLVLAVLAIIAVMKGGAVFGLFLTALCTAMMWELFRMLSRVTDPLLSQVFAGVAGLSFLIAYFAPAALGPLALMVPVVAGFVLLRNDRIVFAIYAVVIATSFMVLDAVRAGAGTLPFLWLVLTVIAADIGAYFGGRALGGPKLAPAISPGKTWSGAVAGWIAGGLVGLGFAPVLGAPALGMMLLGMIIAAFSQLGDLGESWIKRRRGVKDSSNLIPGHGGFMDRFDSMTGAALALLVIQILHGLPFGAAGG